MLNKYYVVKAILLCNGVLTFLDRGSTTYGHGWELGSMNTYSIQFFLEVKLSVKNGK